MDKSKDREELRELVAKEIKVLKDEDDVLTEADVEGIVLYEPEKLTVLQKRFLNSYADIGTVKGACDFSGITRWQYRKWCKDRNFALAMDEAKEKAADVLEIEAIRRAVDGVQEPVFYQGDKVGEITKYSDVLLIFLLKGLRPQKFRDNVKTEVNTGVVQVKMDGETQKWGK